MKNGKLKLAVFRYLFFCVTLLVAFSLSSCSNKLKAEEGGTVEENAVFNDAQFLFEATKNNIEEIEYGKLAQTNSFMPEVHELGKMMQIEHTESMKDVILIADKKNIDLPKEISPEGKEVWKKLADKKGYEFDKEYCNQMVIRHKNAVDLFAQASAKALDSDIRSWAKTMLPILQEQLNYSIDCKKNCEKYM